MKGTLPAVYANSEADVRRAFLEFFGARLRNEHTRKAYSRAAANFLNWCDQNGVGSLELVEPLHVARWIAHLEEWYAAPSVKQSLSGIHMLFEWLALHHVIKGNPARHVKGPRYSVKRGKTPVLSPDEVRRLFESMGGSSPADRRDRTLIGVMTFAFARVGATLRMNVGDVFTHNHRLWIRLLEKGGRVHEMPCHHTLEAYLRDYLLIAETAGESAPLFRSLSRNGGLGSRRLVSSNAYDVILRRAHKAGLTAHACCHSFRATGITTYLANGGSIERAATMANHASIRTTQLYDRRDDQVTLDEVERISF